MMTIEARNAKLDSAKALVLAGWAQGANARDDHGSSVVFESPRATRFCAVGATARVADLGEGAVLAKALRGALAALGFEPKIARYNDAAGRTKYEVAALFDHAKEQPL